LGRTETAFFPTSAGEHSKRYDGGKKYKQVNKGRLIDLLDQFASEYKWTTDKILAHTYYQLKSYGKRIADRNFEERKLWLAIIRASNLSDRGDYERFVRSLKPQDYQEDQKERISTPEGIVVREDL